MKIRFLSPQLRVTPSCYELEDDESGLHFLVDCGLAQGDEDAASLDAQPFAFDPRSIDLVVLTHAHADHCGLIPRLYREGFEGLVHTTAETRALAMLVLRDGARHTTSYDEQDVARIRWSTHTALGSEVSIGRGVGVRFFRAGHILGAASVQICWGPSAHRRSILFSGDLGPTSVGNEYLPLLRPRMTPPVSDYCVIESTYGAHRRAPRERELATRLDRLEHEVHAAVRRGGPLIAPCFAIGRTQDLMFDLHVLHALGRLPEIPVYFDAGLARSASAAYARGLCTELPGINQAGDARELAWLGRGVFELFGLDERDARDRATVLDMIRELFDERHRPTAPRTGAAARWRRLYSRPGARCSIDGPAIIVTGSASCDGGPVRKYLERHLPSPTATVLLTGYSHPRSTAGALERLSGSKAESRRVRWRTHGESSAPRSLTVRATITKLSGYSAHADQADLLDWLLRTGAPEPSPEPASRRVVITHGELAARTALARAIHRASVGRGTPIDLALPPARTTWVRLDAHDAATPARLAA
ncbi:MBL fold metallo-hydrolase [Myxococcota bacterium]|nr:MBL fold metallo-hydrolase [Myxococcota bacterium]